MKRFFPAPILSIALAALWLVLNPSLSPAQWLLAILVGIVGPLFTVSLRPVPVRVRKPRVIARLFVHVLADIFVSNRDVFVGVLRSDRVMPTGTFIRMPIELHDPNGLAVLALIMCITPGTIWTELSLDRSVLLLHIFNLADEDAYIERFKSRYEAPLIEIFQ